MLNLPFGIYKCIIRWQGPNESLNYMKGGKIIVCSNSFMIIPKEKFEVTILNGCTCIRGGIGLRGGGRTTFDSSFSLLFFFLLFNTEFLVRETLALLFLDGTVVFGERTDAAETGGNCWTLASVRASLNCILPFKDTYDETARGGERNHIFTVWGNAYVGTKTPTIVMTTPRNSSFLQSTFFQAQRHNNSLIRTTPKSSLFPII